MPPVEPMPRPVAEFLVLPPLDAHDASYLAASANIANLSMSFILNMAGEDEHTVGVHRSAKVQPSVDVQCLRLEFETNNSARRKLHSVSVS